MGSPLDPQPGEPRSFHLTEGSQPLRFDREGNLWLAHDALLRVPSRELMDDRSSGQPVAPEKFTHTADGLSSDLVRVIFQDREANIWVGTNTGLDRFSRSNVVPLVSLPQCHGIGYAHAAGDSGTLWSCMPEEPIQPWGSSPSRVTVGWLGSKTPAFHGRLSRPWR